jgi:hypothetical protein
MNKYKQPKTVRQEIFFLSNLSPSVTFIYEATGTKGFNEEKEEFEEHC